MQREKFRLYNQISSDIISNDNQMSGEDLVQAEDDSTMRP